MKFAMGCGRLVWAFLLPFAAHSHVAPRLEHLSVSGVEYVRLEDWARANNFQTKWAIPKQDFKLSSDSAVLDFSIDSRRMSINGIHLWLSAPIALLNGSACISRVDLPTAIQPVLTPAKSYSRRPIKKIVIDPGHGGKDPGYCDGKQQEKKYTLLLARELGELLARAGFNPSLTRTADTFLDFPVRPDLARRRGADLFISLHFNSAEMGASGVKGVEVYCMTPPHTSSTNDRGEGAGAGLYPGNRFDSKNVLLAFQLQKALVKNLGAEDRGVRRARWAVLRPAEMPAVLIEGGFMSHPAEANKIYDPGYRRQMAQAIVEGVKAYKNLVEQ